MFKKKKKKQEKFREIELPFEKEEKKRPEMPVHIAKKGDYAVLEPYDIYNQKKTSIEQKPKISKEEVIPIKKKKSKEEEPKKEKIEPEKAKPKLIIQKNKPKEIEPPKIEKPTPKPPPKPPEKDTETQEEIRRIPINEIETEIDELMKIIDEKKVVELEYLSKALKIDVDTLETWAKMLEERGLIEIEYPIIGLPKLRKKEWKKKS